MFAKWTKAELRRTFSSVISFQVILFISGRKLHNSFYHKLYGKNSSSQEKNLFCLLLRNKAEKLKYLLGEDFSHMKILELTT